MDGLPGKREGRGFKARRMTWMHADTAAADTLRGYAPTMDGSRGRAPVPGHPPVCAAGDDDQHGGDDSDHGTVLKTRPKTKKPSMYKVLMLNDDYTPMEFVVHVLERYFSKTHEEATRIMLAVHQRGVGICGVFTYEIAETKVTQVMDLARKHQHPLQCAIEKE